MANLWSGQPPRSTGLLRLCLGLVGILLMKKLVKIDADAHSMLKKLSFRTDRQMGEIVSELVRGAYNEMVEEFKTGKDERTFPRQEGESGF
ncbi:hypothetical protein DC094_09795 [Pelagibaculum spongiae]|uniref:Uncharacterized protein n=2 Tax=Pelagibaculum spongiae TaxID=2080658 RepID=A0A2V1GU34_9GAMM|nr:hypothetical protein DC094_09795 [Pelagibaculum spongiae]